MLRWINPLAWMRWLGQFIYNWALSAPWRDAPKAIPFLILFGVLVVTAAISRSQASGWRTRLLDNQLAVALEKDDFPTAELVLRRQLKDKPDDPKLLHRLALTRDHQEQNEEALDLMRRIVSVKNYQDSARWILRKEYEGKKWSELNDEQRLEFGSLLKLLHEDAPGDISVKRLYADYLIAAEKFPQAVPLLEDLARSQPMRGLQAAALSRRLGNNNNANRLAAQTLEAVSKMSTEDPTNAVLALAVAQNQLFLKRYTEAVRTLDRAVQRAKTKEDQIRLNQAMGDAIVAWVAFIEESPNNTEAERLRILRMLQTALQYAPNNPRVLTLVADQVLGTMDSDSEKIAASRQALIKGSSPGIAHFVQGTAALMKDDVNTAMMHLKIASELMPRSGAILNNLAVAMTTRKDANLEQALKISNTAIKQTPKATPHFFETRGQILFRLKRYLDAIPDLERALALEDLAPKAHEALAECYEKLNQPELAEAHRYASKQPIGEKAKENP